MAKPKKKKARQSPPKQKQTLSAEAFEVLRDESKRKAALVLAYAGYQKHQRRRTGAVTHAARQAGVTREAVYVWLNDPIFVGAIEEVTTELITECFTGLRLAARKGNSQALIELLAQLDPEHDRAWLREKERQAHEERMLRLKVELAKFGSDPEKPDIIPDIVFHETAEGERRVDDDMH